MYEPVLTNRKPQQCFFLKKTFLYVCFRTELFSQGPGPGPHDLNPFAADMDQQNIPDLTVHDIRQHQSQIIRG